MCTASCHFWLYKLTIYIEFVGIPQDLVLIESDNAESSILQAFVELRKLAVTKYPFFRFVDINT